jgi:hypothetical protein
MADRLRTWLHSLWLWPAFIVLLCLAMAVVTFAPAPSPWRPAVAFVFLLICPGMAFVRLLRLSEGPLFWLLAIGLSLALDAIVAMSMVWAQAWSPTGGVAALIAISLVGAALQLIVAVRYPRSDTAALVTTEPAHLAVPGTNGAQPATGESDTVPAGSDRRP